VDTERREIWLLRDGALVGRFFEVAGLGSTTSVAEYNYTDAQGKTLVGKRPNVLTCNEIVLRRGIVLTNSLLAAWRAEVVTMASGFRSTATIELRDGRGAPLASWQLSYAWPSGLQLAPARPGIAVPVEEFKIACEMIARVSSPASSPWPAGAYTFGLEVPGMVSIVVAGASGVGSDSEVRDYNVGEDPLVRRNPGRLLTHDLTLTCEGPCSAEIAGWRQLVADGNIAAARADAVLTMYDAHHAAVARWSLAGAWPSATYVATEDGVEREHVVIVNEGTVQTLP
jgi:phage tail-like protein